MSGPQRFTARIEAAGGGGAYVPVPFDVERVFGKKRVPVVASIDGEPYRGSLVRMGGEQHILGILKDIRARIGKDVGDEVEVVVEEDVTPRVVDVPADLQEALGAAPDAGRAFDALAYSHKREYVRWIDEAKREATRAARIAKAVEMLKRGDKLR